MKIQVDIYTTYFTCYRQSLWWALGIILHNRKQLEFVRIWVFTKRFNSSK